MKKGETSFFMPGFTQGLQRLRRDKEFSMKGLLKYTNVTNAGTWAQLDQTYGVGYSGDRISHVLVAGIEEFLKHTTGKEALEAKAGDSFDNSLVRGLEQSGWFKNLGR